MLIKSTSLSSRAKREISRLILRFLTAFGMTMGWLIYASSVFADHCPTDQTHTDFGCIPHDPAAFTASIYGIGLSLVGGVALLSIVYGAFLVLTSSGDPQKLNIGKSYIVYALGGLALAVGGYALYRIIGVNVIKLPGFE